MKLIKKNIHMCRILSEAVTQLTLEDDRNIPENMPDVNHINLEKARVMAEEIKPGTDVVQIRGTVQFVLLYHTQEQGSTLIAFEGELPFEEKLIMKGVTAADSVSIKGEVEDFSVSCINSRKLSIRSLISLSASVEELYDEEVPIGIYSEEGEAEPEYRKIPVELAQIAICKNDIFRIRDEISVPSNYPNIYRILWYNVQTGDVEFRIMEEKLGVQGEVQLFVLYEGEGEEHPIRSFETTLPFSGVLDCHGCREGMLPDIDCVLGQQDLVVRPDLDGEERCIGLELALDISIRIYEEETVEILADVYGITSKVETQTRRCNLSRMLSCVTGKTKVTEHMRVPADRGVILQVLHSEASVCQIQQSIEENGIRLKGGIGVKVMYITGDDENPYACAEAMIPYGYLLDVPQITPEDVGRVRGRVEQLQVTMLDGEEMDVKAVLCFSTVVFDNFSMDLIEEIQVSDIDSSEVGNLPGMAIYVVNDGDNLWNIGKKYYVSVETLRNLNHLSNDELQPGQKLLVVK